MEPHVEAQIRSFIAKRRSNEPTAATSALHREFRAVHRTLVSLESFKDVQKRSGLANIVKVNGKPVPPTGPYDLTDLVIWDDKTEKAEVGIVCSYCQAINTADYFLTCIACLRAAGRSVYWCKDGDCFQAGQLQHKVICSTLLGILPRPGHVGRTWSEEAEWQLRHHAVNCRAVRERPLLGTEVGPWPHYSDYFITTDDRRKLGLDPKARLRVGAGLAEFRAAYVCAIESDVFTLEQRQRAARYVRTALLDAKFDSRPVDAAQIDLWTSIVDNQLAKEFGISPTAAPRLSLAPDECLDPVLMLNAHCGLGEVNMAPGHPSDCSCPDHFSSVKKVFLNPAARTVTAISAMLGASVPNAAYHLTRAVETGVFRIGKGYRAAPASSQGDLYGPWLGLPVTLARRQETAAYFERFKESKDSLAFNRLALQAVTRMPGYVRERTAQFVAENTSDGSRFHWAISRDPVFWQMVREKMEQLAAVPPIVKNPKPVVSSPPVVASSIDKSAAVSKPSDQIRGRAAAERVTAAHPTAPAQVKTETPAASPVHIAATAIVTPKPTPAKPAPPQPVVTPVKPVPADPIVGQIASALNRIDLKPPTPTPEPVITESVGSIRGEIFGLLAKLSSSADALLYANSLLDEADEKAARKKANRKPTAEMLFPIRQTLRDLAASSDPDAHALKLQAQPAPVASKPEPTSKSVESKPQTPASPASRVPIDAQDVAAIVDKLGVSRPDAIKALRLAKGDLAAALSALRRQ